jgi:hypothetical protein
MIQRTLDAQIQTADQVELVTRSGTKLKVEINTHPIYREGKAIEIQGIATITGDRAGCGPRETQHLLEKVQSRTTPGANKEAQFVYAYDVADNNLSPEITPSLDHQTLFQ